MTKINDIGGEFGLINRVVKKVKNKEVLLGPGDDSAVINIGKQKIVWCTDAIVEGDHFSLDWFSGVQVGMKSIEINASDIFAMGGKPKFALVSIVLRKNVSVEFVDELYKGIYSACKKYGILVVGGNFTHGNQIVVDVSMIGYAGKKIISRSSAKVGDFILVSGDLGGSTAGLNLFRKGIKGHEYVKKKHVEPSANFHKVCKFLPQINAMQDISDGLASEVGHICKASRVGAVIYKDNVPIKDEVFSAAHRLGMDAYDFALYGGEDFEMVFTVSEKNLSKVRGLIVGEIVAGSGVKLYSKGKYGKLIKKGFDHFSN